MHIRIYPGHLSPFDNHLDHLGRLSSIFPSINISHSFDSPVLCFILPFLVFAQLTLAIPALPLFTMAAATMSPKEFEAAMNEPAGPPPPGVVPNFDNPPNMKSAGIGVLIAFFALASLALLLRLYTRFFIVRQFKVSDCKYTFLRTLLSLN